MLIFEIVFYPGGRIKTWVILINITQVFILPPGRKEFKSG